jgi:hypothetical protein
MSSTQRHLDTSLPDDQGSHRRSSNGGGRPSHNLSQSSKWADKGWIGVTNRNIFKAIAVWARSRSNTTTFQKVMGHSSNLENEEADKLAAQGSELLHTKIMNLLASEKFSLLTQSDLCKSILEKRQIPERHPTRHYKMGSQSPEQETSNR